MTTNISKKRKFVADGVFYAELNEVRALRLMPVRPNGCQSEGPSWLRACPRSRSISNPHIETQPPIKLLQLLTRELAEDGYAGVEVRVVPLRTEIIIRATRTQNVLGEKGQRIRELTTVIQKRCVRYVDVV